MQTVTLYQKDKMEDKYMAIIKPFVAVRPDAKVADRVAALPYDVYNRAEAAKEVEREPLSFLKIDRAETQFPDSVDTYAPEVYDKAKEIFEDMVSDGTYITDSDECYYIYSLVMDGRRQTGIAACASVDDYMNNVIKKHEHTLAKKEDDRIRHVDTCNANTGPIFLTYRKNDIISNTVNSWASAHESVYDFVADGVNQTVWVIDDEDIINTISTEFAKIDALYIADGHHRCASAVKVGQKRRKKKAGLHR